MNQDDCQGSVYFYSGNDTDGIHFKWPRINKWPLVCLCGPNLETETIITFWKTKSWLRISKEKVVLFHRKKVVAKYLMECNGNLCWKWRNLNTLVFLCVLFNICKWVHSTCEAPSTDGGRWAGCVFFFYKRSHCFLLSATGSERTREYKNTREHRTYTDQA